MNDVIIFYYLARTYFNKDNNKFKKFVKKEDGENNIVYKRIIPKNIEKTLSKEYSKLVL